MSQRNVLLWRLTCATYARFKDLTTQLDYHHPDSTDYQWLCEQVKGLPGFPYQNDINRDRIHFELVDQE